MPETPVPFAYSADQLQTLVTLISQERLRMYVAMVRSTEADPVARLRRGVRNYEMNTRLSEAMYPVAQGFEVTFRNAIHNRLSADLATANWFEAFAFLESERESITRAKQTITDKQQMLTPDRIVGELSFGFWVKLFSADYERTLWMPSLQHILPAGLTRGAAYSRFKDIKTLRNRIAHHYRIMGRPITVRQAYEQLLETIGCLSPTMRDRVATTNRVLAVLPQPLVQRTAAAADSAVSR